MGLCQIPDEQYQKLTTAALAAGYDDVLAFISSLADDAAVLQSVPCSEVEMSKAEIAASETMIRCGEGDLAAGRTQDIREALLALGEKRGYSLEE